LKVYDSAIIYIVMIPRVQREIERGEARRGGGTT
jgi:hypothetical protein